MTPLHRARKAHWLAFAILTLTLLICAPSLSATVRYAQNPVSFAADQMRALGAYQYDARIEVTQSPLPTVANAGLAPSHESLAIQGRVDLYQEALELSILQGDGGYASGNGALAIRIADGQAQVRKPDGAWEATDLPPGIFSPQSDMIGFLTVARDIVQVGTTQLGDEQLARYTFRIDTLAFAEQMRAQMERSLREQNRLPVGMSMGQIDAYVDATGSGEVLINSAGLPVQQLIRLRLPDEQRSQTFDGTITVNYYEYPSALIGGPSLWLAAVWSDLLLQGLALALGAGALLALLHFRRSRPLYQAITYFVAGLIVLSPLFPATRLSAIAAEQAVPAAAAPPAAPPASDTSDLRSTAFQLASQLGSGTDSDSDGLSDEAEARLLTSPANPDSDGDSLSDSTEVFELGTSPLRRDTDGDGLNDGIEASPFVTADGRSWYFDPFVGDTNNDGNTDYNECIGLVFCPDVDGDLTPNPWDDDNDGDGVVDRLDTAPDTVVSAGPNGSGGLLGVPNGRYTFSINSVLPATTVLADITIRPTNPNRLWYNGNVLDWPEKDFEGQIRRVLKSTLGPNGKLANGDMRLIPMLELEIPYAANSFGGLPVKADYSGSDLPSLSGVDLNNQAAVSAWFQQWLDQAVLDSYQVSVRLKNNSRDLLAYLPLDMLRDPVGNAPVAFTARMPYRPLGSQIPAQTMRLSWGIQMQTDVCTDAPADTSTDGESYNRARWDALPANQRQGKKYVKWEDLSAGQRSSYWCEKAENWRTEATPQIVHTYYDDYYISGMQISEERGLKAAVVVQSPETLANPLIPHHLIDLAQNLDRTLLTGRDCDTVASGSCQGNAQRDITVDGLKARFDTLSNAASIPTARWQLPQNAFRVFDYSFAEQGDMGKLFFGHKANGADQVPYLNTALNEVYAPSSTATITAPTVLVARERTFRTTGLTGATVSPGSASFDFGDQQPFTQVGMSWQTMRYKGAGAWEVFKTDDYWKLFSSAYTAQLQGADPQVAGQPERIAGSVRLLKQFYATLLVGRTQGVQFANLPLNVSSPETADSALSSGSSVSASLSGLVLRLTGLALDTQRHRQLLINTDQAGLLDAVGRQSLYQSGGPTLSLLDDLGKLSNAQVVGGFLNATLSSFQAEEAESNPGLSLTATVIEWSSSAAGMADSIRGLIPFLGDARTYYDNIKALAKAEDAVKAATDAGKAAKDIDALKDTLSQSQAALKESVEGLAEVAKLDVAITIAIEVVIFVGKLIGLIAASNADVITVGKAIVETLVSIGVNLFLMLVIAAIVPIGSIIVTVAGLLDGAIALICLATGLSSSESKLANIFCEGLVGNIVKVLTAVVWDPNPLVDMEASDRLNFDAWQITPVISGTNVRSGMMVGSQLNIAADVALKFAPSTYVQLRTGFVSADALRRSSVDYEFTSAVQQKDERLHVRRNLLLDQMNSAWTPASSTSITLTRQISTSLSLERAAINWKPEGLYIAEGYAVPGKLCITLVCVPYTSKNSNYMNVGESFAFDVLPQTLDQFYSLTDSDGDGGYRLAWDALFPDLVDADGDGLRSKAHGGSDPADNTPDADGDGLSDQFELENSALGVKVNQADSDGDGLSDYHEIRLKLNPAQADLDNDGLNDPDELAGWTIIYGYDSVTGAPKRFQTSSNPFVADTDSDGILDGLEKVYGFNPRVFNSGAILSIQTQLSEADGVSDGIVAGGSAIGYSATITNSLRDRYALGLFETDLASTALSPDLSPAAYRLGPQSQTTASGSFTLPTSGNSDVLLTRAGAIIADLNALTEGRTLWLRLNEESSASQRFSDAGVLGNDATCLPGACPTVDENAYNGRAAVFASGQRLTVAASPSLRTNRFTLSFWVRPTAVGSLDLINRESAPGLNTQLIVRQNTANKVEVLTNGADCASPSAYATSNSLITNQWNFVVVTYDGSTYSSYLNGQLGGTLSYSGDLCQADQPLTIGAGGGSTGLDELSIYPLAMTASQVAQLFRDPVLRIAFNGTYDDLSSLRQQIELKGAGGLSIATARGDDRVAVFDKQRWLATQSSDSLDMGKGSGQFSLSAFVRAVPLGADGTDWQGIIGNDESDSGYPSLYVNSAGQLRATFGTGTKRCDSGASAAVTTPGSWSHVTATYDGTSFIFYVNGVEADRKALPFNCSIGERAVGDSFYIGRTNNRSTFNITTINVVSEGDGFLSSAAEYELRWNDNKVWEDGDVDSGENPAVDKSYIIDDTKANLKLLEIDPISDDMLIDRDIYNYQVEAGSSWSYDEDGYGRLNWSLWNSWFSGNLDEVRVYRVALDADGALNLYKSLDTRSFALRTTLDEPPTTTIFRDASGNLLTGTCAGASCPTTGLVGRAGQAASFDGNDAIAIASHPALDLPSSLTAAAWVKLPNTAARQIIINKYDPAVGGYILGVEGGAVFAEYRDANGSVAVTGGAVAANQWAHLALSLQAGTSLKVYLNGALQQSAALPAAPRSVLAYGFPVPGSIHLYGNSNYEAGGSGNNMDMVYSGNTDTFDPAGIGNDDLNEASSARTAGVCARLYDDENYGGAYQNICDDIWLLNDFNDRAESTRLFTTPPSSSADGLYLSSEGLQYLKINDSDIGRPVFSTVTIAGWVKPNNPRHVESQVILARGMPNGPEGFGLRIASDGRLTFGADNKWWTSTDAISAASEWSHVAVTLDGTKVTFYINGVASGSFNDTATINDLPEPILIGRLPKCGSTTFCDFFDGWMRGVGLFSRALSAAEIAGLMSSPAGAEPLGRIFYLPFDEASGSAGASTSFRNLSWEPIKLTGAPLVIGRASLSVDQFATGLIDEVSISEYALPDAEILSLRDTAPAVRMALDELLNATTFSNIASTAPASCSGAGCPQAGARGRIREAIVFGGNGEADRITVLSDGTPMTGELSLELWVRPGAVRSGEQVLIARASGPNLSDRQYQLSLAANSLNLTFSSCSASLSSLKALNRDQWNHVLVTADGSTLAIYLNGTLDRSASGAICTTGSSDLTIGSSPYGDLPFDGMLDEIAIYKRALAPREVAISYGYQESWFDVVQRTALIVDNDLPSVAIRLENGTVLPDRPLAITITASDPTSAISKVEYDSDGDALADDWQLATLNADGTWGFSYDPPSAGSIPLRARAFDQFNKISPEAATSVIIDSIAPSLTVNSIDANPIRLAEAAAGNEWILPLAGTASDALSPPVKLLVEVVGLDGLVGQVESLGNITSTWRLDYRFPFPPNGKYQIKVQAIDALSNTQVLTATLVNIDTTGPTGDIFDAPEAQDLAQPQLMAALSAAEPKNTQIFRGTINDAPEPTRSFVLARFEEASGAASFANGAIVSRPGQCSACPTAGGLGQLGYGLGFDGLDDSLHFDGLQLASDPFSLLVWVKPQGSGEQVIVSGARAGTTTFDLRLNGSTLTSYATISNTLQVVGSTTLDANAWNQVGFMFDGASLRTLLNGGIADSTALVGPLTLFDQLWVGSRSGAASFYQGELDELGLYATALSPSSIRGMSAPLRSEVQALELSALHLRDLASPETAVALTAVLTPSVNSQHLWSAAAPAGIEGVYTLNVSSTDSLGNSRLQQNIWNGDLDSMAPRVQYFFRDIGGGKAVVKCVVEDYHLDPAQISCPVPSAQWTIENERAAWYTDLFGSRAQAIRMTTGLVVIETAQTMLQACDSFGNCASVVGTIDSPAVDGASLITAPLSGTLFTSYDPIVVQGLALAKQGIQTITVSADGTPILTTTPGGASTSQTWSSSFTPTVDGVYQLQASVGATGGLTYTDLAAPRILVDTVAPEITVDVLRFTDGTGANGQIQVTGTLTEVTGIVGFSARTMGGAVIALPIPPLGAGVPLSVTLDLGVAGPFDNQPISVTLTITDVAGRVSEVIRTVTVDTLAPRLAVTSEVFTPGALPQISGIVTDGNTLSEFSLTIQSPAGISSTYTITPGQPGPDGQTAPWGWAGDTPLTEPGTYHITILVRDAANNVRTLIIERTVLHSYYLPLIDN